MKLKRNMYRWLEDITSSAERKALPIMTYPGLDMINKNVIDVITSGKEQFACINALSKKYPTAATVTIMDLSVEAEAFGSKIKYSDDEVPAVTGNLVSDMEDAKKLNIPRVGDGRTSVYLDTARIASENIIDRPVLAGHIGPFSLAGRLMDMTAMMIAMMEKPEIVHTVLEKCAAFLAEYSSAFKASGVHGVIIAEPAAGLISPAMCNDFSSQYVKRIVRTVQDESFVVILHNCGNTVRLVDAMAATGAKGLHFGNAVKMTDILPQVPADRTVFGNIDPVGVFRNATAEEMIEQVDALLEDMKPFKNFVLSSGCDIPPGVPMHNVDAFFQALGGFNARQKKQCNR
jgi:uroporphyrinogen decarboxylase